MAHFFLLFLFCVVLVFFVLKFHFVFSDKLPVGRLGVTSSKWLWRIDPDVNNVDTNAAFGIEQYEIRLIIVTVRSSRKKMIME